MASIVLMLCLLAAPLAAGVRGVVVDSTGAPVPNAAVDLLSPGGARLTRSQTDSSGAFEFTESPGPGGAIRVDAADFDPVETAVGGGGDLRITLNPAARYARVSVTASRGGMEDATQSAHLLFVKEVSQERSRPLPTLAHALAEEPGVLVQQTASGQVSPFLRGLTGYHVLNLVDGVRFNNSTFRSGPNQYLALIEPSQARRVEAMLGPSGAQYGSDALGGAIQVLTAEPRYASGAGLETHGDVSLLASSADTSTGIAGNVSAARGRHWWLFGGAGRRHDDLRAGGGHDSRNVFHRLFGMPLDDVRELTGSRLAETGYRHYGLHTKYAGRLSPTQSLSAWYQRGGLDRVRGYKDLNGGLGRLLSDFAPQTLDLFYARYEKLAPGRLDSLTGTFSFNQQRDGSARQNLRFTDPVTRDYSRVRSFGYSGQGTAHAGARLAAVFGGELYDERIHSTRFTGPPGAVTRPQRPLYPDGSRYRTYAAFAQSTIEALRERLRISLGGRYTGVRFQSRNDPVFGVAESRQSFSDLTFHTSAGVRVTPWLAVHLLASRGFRAPNLNDIGAIGLNDLGYEIPAAEASIAGALLADTAGEGALSKGQPLSQLRAESLYNYEAGFRVSTGRLYARAHFFDAELYDPIVRRTLLFPAANAPSSLAGLPVSPIAQSSAQRAQGVVTVATALDPRAVKAFVNDGRARYYGTESLLQYALAPRWSARASYSFLAGRELLPDRNIRRLPPQTGAVSLRYGRAFWIEPGLVFAGAQKRLSGGDIDDERIGASRRRSDIADFFRGSRVAGLLDAGGRFLPTGETLLEIQNRVLPGVDDAARVPLYRSTAGWAILQVRGGAPLGERVQLQFSVANLTDQNYRIHGSGIDAPGLDAYVAIRYGW